MSAEGFELGGMSGALGICGYEREGDELARAEMPVGEAVMQPFGLVHGGAYSALAESIASHATHESVAPDMVAMGQANQTTFLRPVTAGTVHGVAHTRHRGRTTWIWDVEMSDDEGRLCALSRVTIAVRPRPDR